MPMIRAPEEYPQHHEICGCFHQYDIAFVQEHLRRQVQQLLRTGTDQGVRGIHFRPGAQYALAPQPAYQFGPQFHIAGRGSILQRRLPCGSMFHPFPHEGSDLQMGKRVLVHESGGQGNQSRDLQSLRHQPADLGRLRAPGQAGVPLFPGGSVS
jgi:hypothetical protein